MAKLPTAESLGNRPSAAGPEGIARYSVTNRSTPSAMTPVGDLSAAAKAKAAAGELDITEGAHLMSLGNQLQARQDAEEKALAVAAKHEQEKLDHLRVADAYNQLQNARLDLTIGEQGYTKVVGAAAVNQPLLTDYTKQYNDQAVALADTLGNDNQKALFAQHTAVDGMRLKEGVLRHVIHERGVYEKEVFDGTVAVQQRNVVANWNNPADVENSLLAINGMIDQRAESGGWPKEYTEAMRLKYNGQVHNSVVQEALANGNIKYAQDWARDHREDIDLPTAKAIDTAVRDGTQRQLVGQYGSMFLQARDSPKALEELDRRVSADQTLDETRKNALLGQIKGRAETLDRRIDAAEQKAQHNRERAQDRWEKQIERGITQVRDMLPYGEPSMRQLEPLINASKGTPMEGEVRQLVEMSNATRAFRGATPVEQESALTRLRGMARTDPSKVDVKMLGVMQGIFDGQQSQLKESGIKFVVQQGLVDPANPAVRPLDTSKPETLAALLPARLQLARAVTDTYQAPLKPFTPEERDLAVATISAGTVPQKRDYFAKLAAAAGNDFAGYNAAVAQLAPDRPVIAMAGIAANRRYDDGAGKLVADKMLIGDAILRPPAGADGKPDQGKLLPMPPESKMRLDFDNYTRDAFSGLPPRARADYFQAAQAIYAADSATAGDKDTSILQPGRWDAAMKQAIGPVEDYKGKRTILPWGKTMGEFKDGLNARINVLAEAGRLPEGVTPQRLRDLPLRPLGDGVYAFQSGDSLVTTATAPGQAPRPIIIDFNQALPWYPSGHGAAAAGAPTTAELEEAAKAARGTRRK